MPIVTTGELITRAATARSAVVAFNIITLEHVEAVIAGAEEAGSPVVLQVSENAVKFRYGRLLPLARAAAWPPNAPPCPSRCTSTTYRATTCCAKPPAPGSAP